MDDINSFQWVILIVHKALGEEKGGGETSIFICFSNLGLVLFFLLSTIKWASLQRALHKAMFTEV